MKLILAILQSGQAGSLLDDLIAAGFRATRVASSGGFLRQRNATLFIGAEDAEVDRVVQMITDRSVRREPEAGLADEAGTGGATVFVLDMVRYERF